MMGYQIVMRCYRSVEAEADDPNALAIDQIVRTGITSRIRAEMDATDLFRTYRGRYQFIVQKELYANGIIAEGMSAPVDAATQAIDREIERLWEALNREDGNSFLGRLRGPINTRCDSEFSESAEDLL